MPIDDIFFQFRSESSSFSLITNVPKDLDSDFDLRRIASIVHVNLEDMIAIGRALEYLKQVSVGNENGPYCPFARAIEEGNGYSMRNYRDAPNELDFAKIVRDLNYHFKLLSRSKTHKDQKVDVTSVIATFSHRDAMNEDFGKILDEVRNIYRVKFLEEGLMISQMHPYHGNGQGTTRPQVSDAYNSAIPMLFVRRMHKEDIVFMNNEQARASYNKFFG